MPNSRFYSSTAAVTQLQSTANAGDVTIQIASSSGFPGSFPYILCLDYGAANEELVLVTNGGPNIFNVTRAFDGTSASTHNAGAVVRHVTSAIDFTDSRTHEAATSNVHGITGAFVDTASVQTLSNKTLSSPSINNPTITGAVTATGSTTNGGTLSGATLSGDSVSGTLTMLSSPAVSGAWSNAGDITNTGQLLQQNLVRGQRTNTTDSIYESRATGDAVARWFMTANGNMNWSDGTNSPDVGLNRSSPGNAQLVGNLTTTGTIFPASVNTTGAVSAGSLSTTGNLSVGGVGGMLFARKPASTNRNSTVVNSPDPDLQLSVVASAVYEVSGMLIFSGDPNADLKIGFTAPTNATFSWNATGQNNAATSTVGPVITDAQTISNTGFILGCLSGNNLTAKIQGLLRTQLTPGTFGLSWSQASSTGTDVILYADSYLRLTRVA